MKLVILYGGVRKKNTYKLVETLKEELLACGPVEFSEIRAHDLPLPYCNSCYSCFFEGESDCPHAEILKPVLEEIIGSDGVIMASPVYSLQISAALKNIIDHLSFVVHRPVMANKKGVAISSTAGAGHKKATSYMKEILHLWGMDKVYSLPVRVAAHELEIGKGLQKKIKRIAGRLYDDIAGRKMYNPSLKNLFYFSIWKAVAEMGKEEGTVDYIYWRDRGWLKEDYFHPIGFPKNKIGRLVYKMTGFGMRKKG